MAGVTLDAAFPTPMDEPRKIMSCHFLGTLPVSMATGIVFVLSFTIVWHQLFFNVSHIVCHIKCFVTHWNIGPFSGFGFLAIISSYFLFFVSFLFWLSAVVLAALQFFCAAVTY